MARAASMFYRFQGVGFGILESRRSLFVPRVRDEGVLRLYVPLQSRFRCEIQWANMLPVCYMYNSAPSALTL